MASLTRSVITAAELDPPPDLIVLPDCRELQLNIAGGILHTPAMCQGFSEALSWLAREWGVWIAAGHDVLVGGRIVAGATLFDPDGDPYIRHPSGRTIAVEDGAERVELAWTIQRTPIGVVALLVGGASPESLKRREEPDPIDLVIIPGGDQDAALDVDALTELAGALSAFVCAVDRRGIIPSTGGDKTPGVIVGRDGAMVTRISPGAPGIGLAVLDITPSPISAGDESEELGNFR
jgi:hypothetical protein